MFLGITRSASSSMDKGACNSVHYQCYGQNSNMVSSVTMYTIGYIILTHHRNTPPSSSVKVVKLL